jgi:hypothetical protein
MLFDRTGLEAAAAAETVLACVSFPEPLPPNRRAGQRSLHKLGDTVTRLEDLKFFKVTRTKRAGQRETQTRPGAGQADEEADKTSTPTPDELWLQLLAPTAEAHLLREQHKLYKEALNAIRKHSLYVASYRAQEKTAQDPAQLARLSVPSIVAVWGPTGCGKRSALRLAAVAQSKPLVELCEPDFVDLETRMQTRGSVFLVRDASLQLLRALSKCKHTAYNSMVFVVSQEEPPWQLGLDKLRAFPVAFWPETSTREVNKNLELVQCLARRLVAHVWPNPSSERSAADHERHVKKYLRAELDKFPDFRRLLVHTALKCSGPADTRREPGSDAEVFRSLFCAAPDALPGKLLKPKQKKGGAAQSQSETDQEARRRRSAAQKLALRSAVSDALQLRLGDELERVASLNALASCASENPDFLLDVKDDGESMERVAKLLDSLTDLDLAQRTHTAVAEARVLVYCAARELAVMSGVAPQVHSERAFGSCACPLPPVKSAPALDMLGFEHLVRAAELEKARSRKAARSEAARSGLVSVLGDQHGQDEDQQPQE